MSSSLIDTHLLSSIENNSLLLSNVRTIVKFYIWPLLVLFGLTGNCLSILVLTRRRLIRTSTNNYLTILAAFDSCYLIFTLILNFCSHPKFVSHPFSHTLTYLLRPFADFSSNTAAWLIVCFTIERTLAVVKPIYAKRTCSVRRSRHIICTLLISCFLITLPTFFERSIVGKDYSIENQLHQNITWTDQEHLLIKLHRIYLVFICVIIIWVPLLVLCVCNSILIWFVQRSCHFDDDIQSNSIYESYQNSTNSINKLDSSTPAHRRSSLISSCSITSPNSFQLRRHSRPINQKRRVTIVLIVCLFVALFLWTPQSISLTYETFVQCYVEMTHEHRIILLIFNNFANLFLCLNASIDFLLYCFLSEKFARTCKQILFRQCTNSMIIKNPNLNAISTERASFILANSPNTIHQQQLAANTTNKYYFQLSNFYQNSTDLKSNKNWKKKFTRSITMNTKSEKKIFYQQNLVKDKQQFSRMTKPVNILSNPVLDLIDENKEIEDSSNTLCTNSAKQSRSGTLTNI